LKPVSTGGAAGWSIPAEIADSGSEIYLFDRFGQVIDYVQFGAQVAGLSIGKSTNVWTLLATGTPAAANAAPAVLGNADLVRINEWMADPVSGDDWFELFNPEASPVNIGGFYVTDDPSVAGRTNTAVAPLTFLAPGGFILLQADGETDKGPDHVGFSLDVLGETVRLYNNLFKVDEVLLLVQTAGVSEGRYPDGSTNFVQFPGTPTPSGPNAAPSSDADGDGLPDAWEDANGLNRLSAADALLDGDSDGMSNLAEFRAGTDPRNEASVLMLTIEMDGSGQRVLNFRAAANKSYSVLSTESITTPIWERVGNVLPGSDREVDLLDDEAGSQVRFYRIISPMQP
ncbi:MAG TPA: lamin tail domain-containing protein, partial [Candidatus Kapabacteria bacterium]|nr:lamin tail domain-containing protein [Candidatus Kapabacteria bacterium]